MLKGVRTYVRQEECNKHTAVTVALISATYMCRAYPSTCTAFGVILESAPSCTVPHEGLRHFPVRMQVSVITVILPVRMQVSIITVIVRMQVSMITVILPVRMQVLVITVVLPVKMQVLVITIFLDEKNVCFNYHGT